MKRLFAITAIVALALASFGQININGKLLNVGDTITYNGKVSYINENYELVDYKGRLPRVYDENKNSTYYLKKSSKNLSTGFVFAGIGATILSTKYKVFPVDFDTKLGSTKDKNENNRKLYAAVGIISTAFGVLELIIGAKQIKRAAWCIDKERQIYLTPSNKDIGMTIRF